MSHLKTESSRDGMPFYGENILNFLFKIIIGAILFWILYYPIFNMGNTDMDLLTRLSYIMLFSTMSSLTALIISWFIVSLILRASGRPKKGYTDLNSLFDFDKWLYEMVAIMINAILIVTGIMIFISSITTDWTQFFMLYILTKIIARLVAYLIKGLLGKNIIIELSFLIIFFVILFISVQQIAGGILIE